MPTDSTVDQLLAAAGCGDLNEVGLILRNYPNMDINCGDRCKSSALHYAAEKGHIDVVSLLIKKGAIVNVRNMWEKTPLHSASNHGHLEIVKLLIDNGARYMCLLIMLVDIDDGEQYLDTAFNLQTHCSY